MLRTAVSIRLCALAVAFLMMAGAARAETSVYYIPAEFPEVCAELLSTPGAHDCPGGVTHQAPAFCDAGLRGLTLALQALGLPACDAGNADLPGFDMVVVVDDRNLSPRMTEISAFPLPMQQFS